jgi:hypothetical protein
MDRNIVIKDERVRTEKKRINGAKPFWMKKSVATILCLLLVIADAANNYTVFDSIFTQSELVGYILTFTVSFCLEMFPIILARLIKLQLYTPNKSRIYVIYLLGVTFLVLFILTFLLRVDCRDILFSTPSFMEDVSNHSYGISPDSATAWAATIMLGFAVFATSALAFALEWFSGDPIKNQLDNEKIIKAESEERIDRLSAYIHLLSSKNITDFLKDYDKKALETALLYAEKEAAYQKSKSEFELAKKLGTPDDISIITDQGGNNNE